MVGAMLIAKHVLEEIPDDFGQAVQYIVRCFATDVDVERLNMNGEGSIFSNEDEQSTYHQLAIEYLSIMLNIFENYGENTPKGVPTLIGDPEKDFLLIARYMGKCSDAAQRISAHRMLQDSRQTYKQYTSKTFFYKLDNSDVQRAQQILNELRELLADSQVLDNDHKRRLLEKVEALQRELHKRMSDLDRIWGLIGEAGVLLGKFGRDVKPLTDRIRELVGIAWRSQATSEQLPTPEQPLPQLMSPDEEDAE